ncbi:MAG TPA: type II secretion system F family protein [Jatrophihabitans sp.]|jgi:tight adherence protein B|uniref:type II secretion system F family protein n=1 Tax=Jatrophihabitans sp. TaxID=1932789 RepID=UPI002E044D7C|nr:type II secretion system F family protein [Jatrophihabitans sp.]
MTATTWCALAAALLVSVLPSPVRARADDLAVRGRLVGVGRARRRYGMPARVRPAGIGAAALLSAVVAVSGGPVLAGAAAAVLAVAGVFGRDALRRRAAERWQRSLLTALRVLVGELEAGAGLAGALAAAATVGGPPAARFGWAAELVARGDDPTAVFAPVGSGDELRGIAAAWRVSDVTGAAPAAVLERVARDVAAADDRRRAVTVALAGPRSSALVLSLLPVVGIGLGGAMGADPIAFLIGAPVGRFLCAAGVLLDLAGLLWIRSLVRRAER